MSRLSPAQIFEAFMESDIAGPWERVGYDYVRTHPLKLKTYATITQNQHWVVSMPGLRIDEQKLRYNFPSLKAAKQMADAELIRQHVTLLKREKGKLSAILNPYFTYIPDFGDARLCVCGHEYHRHFDSYENMEPCGCKYCSCRTFSL